MSKNNQLWLKTIPLLNSEAGQKTVHEFCKKHGFPSDVFFDLLNAEINRDSGLQRRDFESFDEIFREMNDNVD